MTYEDPVEMPETYALTTQDYSDVTDCSTEYGMTGTELGTVLGVIATNDPTNEAKIRRLISVALAKLRLAG